MTKSSEKQPQDEADRLAKAAFWITIAGVISYTGSVITFIL
jgi:hypothetical protein